MRVVKGNEYGEESNFRIWLEVFERISVQGTNFLVTLLLARLLTPSDYGTVSVVTIFIALATTFVQGGFNTALIQKKDVDGNDYLTILMFSEIVAAALYAVIFSLHLLLVIFIIHRS